MKIKKSLKFLTVGLGVIGPVAFGLNLVSCGHETAPIKPVNNWAEFKSSASKEAEINIVKNTNPTDWDDATGKQLKHENIRFRSNPYKVILDIRRTIDQYKGTYIATFSIEYLDNQKYNASDWVCNIEPKFVASNWTEFKNAALSATPEDLFNAAHPWVDKNKFKWEFGTAEQTTWASTDTAEFDTFGNVDNSDAYKGMNGKPVADDNAKTITAIISKKGKNGAYDSDPIKEVLTFKAGQDYQVFDWGSSVITPIKQLQSYNKFMTFWKRAKTLYDNGDVGNFMGQYWMTLKKDTDPNIDTTGKAHSKDYHIYDTLTHNGYSKIKNLTFGPCASPSKKGEYSYGCSISIKFDSIHDNPEMLVLSFAYNIANGEKDITAGGTAFNDVWTGVAHTT